MALGPGGGAADSSGDGTISCGRLEASLFVSAFSFPGSPQWVGIHGR